MAATALSPTVRYIPPGTRQYYWVTDIEDKNNPTRVELDAGTDLTTEIAAVEGFQVTSEAVDTPDVGTVFTSKITGRTTADDSSFTLYLSSDSDDSRSLFARGDDRFMVIFPEGDDEGLGTATMDVFPVRVGSTPKLQDVENPAQMTVSCYVTSEPVENVAVPSV